jgi:hypothetical protein
VKIGQAVRRAAGGNDARLRLSIAETGATEPASMLLESGDALRWISHFEGSDSIAYLMRGTDELARVAQRVDRRGWLSEVARHRRNWRARPSLVAPTRRLAMKWAQAWTHANLQRTLELELPPLVQTQCGTWTQSVAAYGAAPRAVLAVTRLASLW